MKNHSLIGISFAAFILAGCSSPQTMYYTLSAPTQSDTPTTVWHKPYQLNALTVPAQVDDTPLIVRQSTDQLMVLNQDRWTAPLQDQLKDALIQALTQKLGMPPVQNMDFSSRQGGAQKITVDVQRFDLLPGKAALLDAVWQISRESGSPLTCYSTLRTSSDIGVAALVTAQQNNIVDLAAQIAQTLRTGKQPDRVRCL